MSIHTSQVFEYLDAHPIQSYEGRFETFLEMLHYIYTVSNPIDSEGIRLGFQHVHHIIEKLPPTDVDALYQIIYDLCFEYELHAFAHGMIVGMNLMTEINIFQ